MGILKKIFDSNKREVKSLSKLADKVIAYEDAMAALSDEELQAKTPAFKAYIQEELEKGKKLQKILDGILPEAFAVIREAAFRVLGMKPYKVQIMGGIALHKGDIAEMRTGEGKTLTATLPVYLNALSGKGVHVVTVNEYLSKRDKEEMGQVYEWIGLTVGLNLNALAPYEKKEAYNQDVTYSTNSELGFDYLRDNMVIRAEDRVLRGLNYAVIDEVDSVLIDEARTPLIISGQAEQSTNLYTAADAFVRTLKEERDYTIDIKTKQILITEEGIDRAEAYFGLKNLYDLQNVNIMHHINQALRANYILFKDIDYVVAPGEKTEFEILIVDQFTGRTMPGRRYSEGLHQAIEAKEAIEIQAESKTMATITYQNFFRMYHKLSGMTGTAKTEEEEFRNIYNMSVTTIPTNKPILRQDQPDLIYVTMKAKFEAVADEVARIHKTGQPVLLGTVAIETSEIISKLLTRRGVKHEVLNAKQNEREAEIVKDAGQVGAVTIATNMAGRGTDIKLGEGVRDLGGLAVIGTERHESRRIDNQLRGRAGRQGDPGYSRFYLSLEDELMIRFGSDRMQNMMKRLGMEDSTPIESGMVSRSVESAQKRVEGNNFDSRKQVLQYDEVLRKQRGIIYGERNEAIDLPSVRHTIKQMLSNSLERAVAVHFNTEEYDEDSLEFDYTPFIRYVNEMYLPEGKLTADELRRQEPEEIKNIVSQKIDEEYEVRKELFGDESMHQIEKIILLRSIDSRWTDHIDEMDQLRRGIHLRSYGQIDPLREYQNEGFEMFEDMIASIEDEVARLMMKAQINREEEIAREEMERKLQQLQANDGKAKEKLSPRINPEKQAQREIENKA